MSWRLRLSDEGDGLAADVEDGVVEGPQGKPKDEVRALATFRQGPHVVERLQVEAHSHFFPRDARQPECQGRRLPEVDEPGCGVEDFRRQYQGGGSGVLQQASLEKSGTDHLNIEALKLRYGSSERNQLQLWIPVSAFGMQLGASGSP